MRKITGLDPIFDSFIKGNNQYIFNLFYRIRSDSDPLILTDDSAYILAQSNEYTPIWIFLKHQPSEATCEEISQLILQRLQINPNINVTGQPEYLDSILSRITTLSNYAYSLRTQLNAYACFSVKEPIAKGCLINPSEHYKDDIAHLFREMLYDTEHIDINDVQAYSFAEEMLKLNSIYLWKDESIVAMARIAHRTNQFARINTVVTDRTKRCNGYAQMLVAQISKDLIKQQITPMLYADANYAASNAAYIKIGYEKQGTINEYSFTEEN